MFYVDFMFGAAVDQRRCTLMTQSYLVTEDDNKKLNSNQEVFTWLVEVLDRTIRGLSWRAVRFAVIEVITVR